MSPTNCRNAPLTSPLARAFATLLVLASAQACAIHHRLMGQVVDRNGQPVPRASITLTPGDVALVTDQDGRFLIDYIRTGEDARRVPVPGHRDYTVELFKPGFHVKTFDFFYARGLHDFGRIEMTEETIEVRQDELDLDVGLYSTPTHAAGANYEGQ